jgi:UDP-N-acetylglucosamine/UDP-N-acetylgalactosamine diphosphorylase
VLTPSPSEHANARRIGEEALRAGRVGVLLVAGGQGSRLGFEGPKGIFPIGPVSDAPLFEVHAHKVLALERRYGANVPLYIMTSDTNDAATRDFFSAHGHFGLSPDRVVFFMQGMWPALTSDGRIVLDAPDHVFVSPDGHGGILSALKANGALDDMRTRGLQTLFYFQVDNPLVDVADAAFIGLHRSHHADVSVKVCAKRDPDEGLGVVVVRDGRHAVVEYTELTAEQKHARTPGGDLEFLYGSVAIHVFSLDFLVREAEAGLPIHVAHKKVPYCDGDGKPVKPTQPNAFKFERFIFDTIPDASRVLNVAFAREDEFSPVKNAEGADSPATTRRDQTRKYARWLEAAGVVVPRGPGGEPAHAIEIDPLFALDAAELKGRLPRGFSVSGPVLLR